MKDTIMIKKPKIAVAGSSGRLGSALVDGLNKNYTIFSVSRTANNSSLSDFDITDKHKTYAAIKKLSQLGVPVILNATGNVGVDQYEHERGNKNGVLYQTHVIGAKNIAEACKSYGILLIHFSTEYVFTGNKKGKTYTEDEKPDTNIKTAPTWYGITKALGEEQIQTEYPSGSLIVRLSQVQHKTWGLFSKTFHDLSIRKPFTRNNDQYISPITTTTVTDALSVIEPAVRTQKYRGIIHISARDAYNPYKIALRIAKKMGVQDELKNVIQPISVKTLIKKGEHKAFRPIHSILNVQKFEKDFGKGILKTVDEEIELFKKLFF